MDAKLTLKLDQQTIERAKQYAAAQRVSLSKLIENYLTALTAEKKQGDIEISPFVKSLATGTNIPVDYDYKTAYSQHLNKKHQ